MRLHRFIGQFDLNQKELEITELDLVHQITKVLRLTTGDQFILSDGGCNEALVEIKNITKKNLLVEILNTYKNENEPENKISLYCAILKRENFELVEKIIKEAAEQSGRGIVPLLHPITKFQDAIKNLPPNTTNTLFDPSGISIENWKLEIGNYKNSTRIFIGPEGGFSENEVKFAKENEVGIASLGKLILRAETAAIVASYKTINQ